MQKELELVHAMQRIRCQLPRLYAEGDKSDTHIADRRRKVPGFGNVFAYRPVMGPPYWEDCLEDLAGVEEFLLAASGSPQQHRRSRGLLLTAKQKQLQKQREQQREELEEEQWLMKEGQWWVTICRLQDIVKGVPGIKPDYTWNRTKPLETCWD